MISQHESIEKNDKEKEVTMRVASKSANSKVAGAIIKFVEQEYDVSLVAMGAAAVNQMTKASIIAKGILASKGIDMVVVPSFKNEVVNEVTKTAIMYVIRYNKMR